MAGSTSTKAGFDIVRRYGDEGHMHEKNTAEDQQTASASAGVVELYLQRKWEKKQINVETRKPPNFSTSVSVKPAIRKYVRDNECIFPASW